MRYNPRVHRLDLSTDDTHNVFRIHGDEFFLEHLDQAGLRPRGSNSSVFRAQHPDGDEAYIVKFFRFLRESDLPRDRVRLQRFEREIDALKTVQGSPYKESTIPIIDDGVFPVRVRDTRRTLRYYVMTEADCDLLAYLRDNELSLQQRVFFCTELLRMLRGLHALDIYHRDIKPNNILIKENRPLFGDLGLINFRNEDLDLDIHDEKIGPVGFLSPEATNKCLGIRNRVSFTFDCWIDDKSDIFQLGQVFWLILQGEVPTGQLAAADVKFEAARIFSEIIVPMLQYPKARRASADAIGAAFEPILQEVALV